MIACVPLPHRAAFRLEGRDRFTFLQRLLTQDVRPCEEGATVWGALLTPQGKFLHDLFVTPCGEALWLETDADGMDDLKAELARLRLRATVTFPGGASGPEVFGILTPDNLPRSVTKTSAFHLYRDPRHPALGFRALRFAPEPLPFPTQPFEAWDRHRLALGIPDGRRDLPPGDSYPAEGGLSELNGISFTKGCYIGQEVTTRLHHRGALRRRLWPVRTPGPLPPSGTPVTLDQKTVGVLRSHASDLALALLEDEAARHGQSTPDDLPLLCAGARLEPFLPVWRSGA